MHVTAGAAKGHKIKVPKKISIRPTQDMVRQAIFSIISGEIKDTKILDLFAGSGALGMEALSRGAHTCDFVDLDLNCCKTIRENLAHFYLQGKGRVTCKSAARFIKSAFPKHYDIVFLDPPYSFMNLPMLILSLSAIIKPNGLVVVEHKKSVKFTQPLDKLIVVDRREYGNTAVTFFKKLDPSTSSG